MFCKGDGGKLSPGQFREILAAAQRRSGLRRIKWHELRHSFASILTTGGAPLRIVQSLIGHSSIRMTERYFTSPGVVGPNDGAIVRVPIAGGAPTTLVDGQASPEGIAVDASGVYCLDTGVGAVMGLGSAPTRGPGRHSIRPCIRRAAVRSYASS